MSLNTEHIGTIARLARLALSEAEKERMCAQLNQFFDTVVAPMQNIDTVGVVPLAHPTDVAAAVSLRLQDDAATEPDRRAVNQASAPQVQDGLFLVPRVIE